jgi:hypothetical protein
MDRSIEQCLLLYGSKGHATAALVKKINETSGGLQNMRITHAGFLIFGSDANATKHKGVAADLRR